MNSYLVNSGNAGAKMENFDWAVIIATFLGPISAVVITLWSQDRLLKRQERRQLLSTMMRYRRDIISTEFVGALNLVPVHFGQRASVMDRYSNLMKTFGDVGWKVPDAVPALNDRVETEVAYLLSEMSKVVGSNIDQLHILRGAYAPQGWANEQDKRNRIQDGLLDILEHRRALPVLAALQPAASSVTEGAAETTNQPSNS